MWTLAQLRGASAVDWTRLAAEAGYSDQSHLARDFRRVGAATPTEYLRRATPAVDALIDEERPLSS
jgi:AraC-like DNA-binding protein